MQRSVVVDSGFLAALLDRRDQHHQWALTQASEHTPPWRTCEAVLTESIYLLGPAGTLALSELIRHSALEVSFHFDDDAEAVLKLLKKYADLPTSLADACLVRMTETLPNPIVLTTDSDFRMYRRQSRLMIPCVLPS